MSETGPENQPDEAMIDLLIKQVTEGLSPDEQRALDVLDSAVASEYSQDFERAAAAITLAASASPLESPPAALKARLEEQARDFFASRRPVELAAAREAAPPRPRAAAWTGAAGWYAAAACMLLALFAWLRSPPPAKPVVQAPPVTQAPTTPVVSTPAAPPTPAEERAALLAQAGSIKVQLAPTKDPAAEGVTGDVVWDPVTQRGFLHFVGLKPNDPRLQQYQAWIIDGGRDKRYPLDAGVFDVPADSSEVIVRIRSELPVRVAKAFAVTVEKPGGVVVSAQHHVVALGAAS
jgi:hypothetical protein